MFEKYIADAKNNPKAIQDLCETQRNSRNENSKQQLLSQDFKGVRMDEILIGLLNESGYMDPRNNLCIWARPTNAVVNVAAEIQKELRALAPSMVLSLSLTLSSRRYFYSEVLIPSFYHRYMDHSAVMFAHDGPGDCSLGDTGCSSFLHNEAPTLLEEIGKLHSRASHTTYQAQTLF
jgi:hypothetical protein